MISSALTARCPARTCMSCTAMSGIVSGAMSTATMPLVALAAVLAPAQLERSMSLVDAARLVEAGHCDCDVHVVWLCSLYASYYIHNAMPLK